VQALSGAGLFRIAGSRRVGGAEATPREQILAIEAISEGDGAAGWALMIGIEVLGFASGLLRPDVAEEVIAKHPETVFCGALNPLGRATPVAGGFRVSGQWPFASGCLHSDWFWGQCLVEGRERLETVEVLVPRNEFRVLDTWHVAGLRGSGHDVELEVSCPSASPRWWAAVYETGPLFRMPPFSRLAYNRIASRPASRARRLMPSSAARRVPRACARRCAAPLAQESIVEAALGAPSPQSEDCGVRRSRTGCPAPARARWFSSRVAKRDRLGARSRIITPPPARRPTCCRARSSGACATCTSSANTSWCRRP
jgi:hypothetical protein